MKRYFFAMIIVIVSLTISLMPTQAQSVAQDLLGRINGLRAELGLAPYTTNGALTAAAQNHAQWMVDTQQVTHVQDNGSSPQTRAQANGYQSRWVSENIYMGGLASINSAWTFWINSPIHYRGLTSANFSEIGIASAQGAGGQAYVLVFGVPPGSSAIVSNNGGNASSNAPAAPPIAIVGYDDVGNIQYEMQAGDTLGDVLLLFGYTWDDLNTVLDLNSFTDADIRSMNVGQVVLVPPPQGTYTPTPLAIENTEEATIAEVTEDIVTDVTESVSINISSTAEVSSTITQTADAQTSGIIPTPDPNMTDAVVEVDEQIGQPVTFVAITATPTITSTVTAIPTLQIHTQVTSVRVAQVNTPIPNEPIIEASPRTNSNTPPLWLIGAIIIQVGVLGFATIEYFRRMKR